MSIRNGVDRDLDMGGESLVQKAAKSFVRKALQDDECPCCGAPGNTDVEERPRAFEALAEAVR